VVLQVNVIRVHIFFSSDEKEIMRPAHFLALNQVAVKPVRTIVAKETWQLLGYSFIDCIFSDAYFSILQTFWDQHC